MATAPDAVDQSFAAIDPATAQARGIRVVADYLSHDSAKDWTPDQVRAYHQHGVGCMFLFETTTNRALSGSAGGLADGRYAANELQGLIRMVGYTPPGKVSVVAAIDFDTVPSQVPTIRAYMSGFRVGLADSFLTGAYGEADILDALGAVIDVGFQTYAWSGGRLSARAALYQYLNGQTIGGAAVDFDRIIHADQLGAWWPPGLEPAGGGTPIGPTPTPTPVREDTDMSFRIYQDPGSPAVAAFGGTWRVDMNDQAQIAVWLSFPDCLSKAVEAADQTHWDQLQRLVAYRASAPAGVLTPTYPTVATAVSFPGYTGTVILTPEATS